MNSIPEVVFCTHDRPGSLGGPFTWLRKLLPSLREAGINSRVLALTHFGGTGPVIEGLKEDGFRVDATDCHPRMEDQIQWILRNLANNPPAVFVPNFVVSALYAARWVKQAGAVTIGVLHSDDAYYRAIQKQFLAGHPEFQLTDIVCVSQALQNEVLQLKQTHSFCSTYIPYGVTVPSESKPRTGKPFRIAYVGRLAEQQKRISLVTRSMIAACRQIPDTEAILFGDGPERHLVEQIIRQEGEGAAITLAGAIPIGNVQNELLTCNVIVLLSDYEGLPIALLEGMACGCVAVCRDINSGIPQLIQNGKTGILVSEKTDDFVDAIRRLESKPNLTEEIRRNGRDLILREYSHENSVRKWAELLKLRISDAQPRPISIPAKTPLPPLLSDMEHPSSRQKLPSHLLHVIKRLRIRLGGLRRKLLR